MGISVPVLVNETTCLFLSAFSSIKKRKTYTDPRLAFAVYDETVSNPFASNDTAANSVECEQSASMATNNFTQRFDSYSTAMTVLDGQDLSGLYMVVTGANCGIGFETARALLLHGAHVTLACRNQTLASQAAEKLLQELAQQQQPESSRVTCLQLDLASLDSVRRFANQYRALVGRLDVLVLNAAVFAPPFSVTTDGYESSLAVNHLGHFYLTRLLLDLLRKRNVDRPRQLKRVVVLSSESHRGASFRCAEELVDLSSLNASAARYIGMTAYNDSKLCNLLFVNELHRRLSEEPQDETSSRVFVFGVHPGNMVSTQLPRSWWLYRLLFWLVRPFTKSLEQAAATSCLAVADRQLELHDGAYLNNCCLCESSRAARDAQLASRLWTLSEQCIDKFERENPL